MDLPEAVGGDRPVARRRPFVQHPLADPPLTVDQQSRPVGGRDRHQLRPRRPGLLGHRRRPRVGDRAAPVGQRDDHGCDRWPAARPGPDHRPDSASGSASPARRGVWSVPTSCTSPAHSIPASRCNCSATTAAFNRRCAARSTCWKSQPPQSPGPATGHRVGTRSGLGSRI